MTHQQLCQVYPWMDLMLADTLLKLDERGSLEERFKDYETPPMEEPRSIVGISVDERKSLSSVTEDEGEPEPHDVDRLVAEHDGGQDPCTRPQSPV
jgi:hypothetical protein